MKKEDCQMAKKERALSAAETALLGARQRLEVATKANTDKPTDKTAAAVEAVKAEVAGYVKTVNRERFVRVGGGRVIKGRAAIRNIAAVAQPRSYTYDESDVAKLESALNSEVTKTVAKLRAALTKGPAAAKAEDDFTF